MSSSKHPSMLASGISAQMYISYSIATLNGRRPTKADGVAAVPFFTPMSPTIDLDYYGVFSGVFGADAAKHYAERLHVVIAKGIEDELVADAPRFLERPDDVEGWWTKLILEAFHVVDEELVAKVRTAVTVGSPAVVALVMKDYLVFASRGATCRAVLYRGGEEAVQLTSERRPEPCKEKEEQNVQNAGGHVVGSSCNLEGHTETSLPTLFRIYFPKQEVLMVERELRHKFLILATDGLWDHVTPAEAGRFIQKKLRTNSPDILAKELAELAMHRGSMGNVTVLIILFNNF